MRKILFTLTFALMAFLAHAETEIDGIFYILNSSARTAKVTYGSKEYLGTVIIPSTVSYRGYSYLVTSIGNFAFDGCSGLTSVTIPNSVTRIGGNAFCCCTGIAKCIIPNSVTNIEAGTFDGCTGLTTVTIPNSVESMGNYAFYGCFGLKSITIPNSVQSIGYLAFSGTYNVNSIIVNSYNSKYDSRNNCNAIIETASNKLIVGCKNTVIPNSVTTIGDEAFNYCFSLTTVTIPNSVTSIGRGVFYGCI